MRIVGENVNWSNLFEILQKFLKKTKNTINTMIVYLSPYLKNKLLLDSLVLSVYLKHKFKTNPKFYVHYKMIFKRHKNNLMAHQQMI